MNTGKADKVTLVFMPKGQNFIRQSKKGALYTSRVPPSANRSQPVLGIKVRVIITRHMELVGKSSPRVVWLFFL